MNEDLVNDSQKMRFRIALILAIIADVVQIAFLPVFLEGAASPGTMPWTRVWGSR